MSINEKIATIVGALSILTTVFMAHRSLVKHMVRDYLSELKPNGGSSIKDKVNDIDLKVNKLENRIDQIYLLLIDKK